MSLQSWEFLTLFLPRLQADGQYVDQDEEEEELQNFAEDLRTKIKSKEEVEEEKVKCKYPGINGPSQQDTMRILMNKIKQHSKQPAEPSYREGMAERYDP